MELSGRFGRRFKEAELLRFKGLPERSVARAFQKIFPDLNLTIDEIVALRLEQLRCHFDRVQMIPGALSFLQRAKADGFRLGLTTSAARSIQLLACQTFALTSYFEAVITGDDIEVGKPDPEPYVRTAAKLDLRTNECMVVEDAVNGVLSGKAQVASWWRLRPRSPPALWSQQVPISLCLLFLRSRSISSKSRPEAPRKVNRSAAQRWSRCALPTSLAGQVVRITLRNQGVFGETRAELPARAGFLVGCRLYLLHHHFKCFGHPVT